MSQFVEVDIPQGRLRGKRVTSSTNGVTYYSFQGVPYAKPPVGPLRFKPAEDPESWAGIRDATVEGNVSPQVDIFTKKLVGQEDCLFLSVYTQQWPATSPKAVMVWIHGGGFTWGSGNTDVYGPDFLVAEDIVLVTINYRLGALGFLYLDGADVTGNNGLRDQVMALKWVKNNITHFGGDPDNVTIFGESAGGTSVHYLVLSPLATGLFHRAIAQSGTALLGACHTPHDVSSQRAVRLAKALGCAYEDPQQVADFLRTVPAEKIVAHHSDVLTPEEKRRAYVRGFSPCEEVGPEAFLPGSPRRLLQKGLFTKVPFICGITSGEGKFRLVEAGRCATLSEIGENFENLLPPNLAWNIGTERGREIAGSIKKFYFGERNLNDETVSQYIDLMSDLLQVYPLHQTVQYQARWSPHPTYVYLFDHVSNPEVGVMPRAMDHIPGAIHTAELPYLFQSAMKPTTFSPGTPDAVFFETFIKLWTQFAKTGNPSGRNANVTWVPATQGTNRYLKMNGGFNMDSDMYKERVDFLEDLYSKYGPR